MRARVVNYLNLGDPAPGLVKRLELSYTYAGQDHDIVVPDDQNLSIGAAANRHRYRLAGDRHADRLRFTCTFTPTPSGHVPTSRAAFAASTRSWRRYWLSGGAIDLSASTDPRWNGKFHMEMYWWHGAHRALWNRWPVLDRSLDVYERFHRTARDRAQSQGFRGARWPKCTTGVLVPERPGGEEVRGFGDDVAPLVQRALVGMRPVVHLGQEDGVRLLPHQQGVDDVR